MSIKVYSTQSCPYCVMAKDYLKNKGISYQEFDVSRDTQAASEMINKSGQRGVPVIDIDGTIVVGFDKDRIDQLISAK